MRHGPHHGAHRSSTIGSGERSTSAANVASVTVTGLAWMGRGVLHRPHTGARPRSILSWGTRLVTPQEGQRISCVSGMATSLSQVGDELLRYVEFGLIDVAPGPSLTRLEGRDYRVGRLVEMPCCMTPRRT